MRYKYIFVILFVVLSTSSLFLPNICFATTNTISIESPSAILIHANTGTVLFEKDAHTKRYPASTTKIMTAILVLEAKNDLLEKATVSNTAIAPISNIYSHASLQVGEQLTLEQLLNVLLIPSANDAANVLAEHIAGSIPAFAEMMNNKALELGCKSTHFVNPSGIHSEEHYSTAYDLSLIANYAMKNSTFRSIVCKTTCSLPATEQYHKEDRIFFNTNALILPDSSYYYPFTTGIKTGFTTPAGNCLVSSSSHNELDFIAVVLGSFENNEISQRYSDTKRLFDFAYSNFSVKTLKNKNDIVETVEIANAKESAKILNVVCSEDIKAFIENNTEAVPEIVIKDKLSAPIYQGELVGNIKYSIMGISYEANLIAGNNVEKETITPLITKIIMGSISFLILVCIFFGTRKPKVEEIDLFR